MRNTTHPLCLAALALAAAALTGCQTYQQKTAETKNLWKSGNYAAAAADFTQKAEKAKDGKDALVYRLEQATALRAAGKIPESIEAFQQADDLINAYEEKAKTSVSSETGAILSNQANLPYTGRDYDKVMVNTYKALNYLQLGQTEKARPEVIRTFQRQQDAVENNKKRIEKEEEEIRKAADEKKNESKSVEQAKADPKVGGLLKDNYAALDTLKAYADYVNPFPVYLDGLYFLTFASGGSDLERARKSFERVKGLSGENKYINADLAVAEKAANGEPVPPRTYVVFETGSAPARDQFRLDIPVFFIGSGRVPYVGAAFPKLEFDPNFVPNLNVTAGGATETTTLLASMDGVIGQAFKNELPSIITKTLLSTTIKATASYFVNKAAEDSGGAIAGLLSKVATTATQAAINIADTRTWTTLPKEFQYCSFPTPADSKLDIAAPNGQKTGVAVEPNSTSLVLVKSVGPGTPLVVNVIKLK